MNSSRLSNHGSTNSSPARAVRRRVRTPPRLLYTSGRHAMFLVYEPACSTLSSAPWQAFCASPRAFLGVATLCMICSSARLI